VRRKSKAAEEFIDGLIAHIEGHVLRQKQNAGKREAEIQRGLYPLIAGYLSEHFQNESPKDYERRAADAVYWEGQDDPNTETKTPVFAARSYPDFIIREPYRIAIEYKQSNTGALVKQCIGQGLMYMLSGDYDFAYLLFDDQTDDKSIRKSMKSPLELEIKHRLWKDFNIKMWIL